MVQVVLHYESGTFKRWVSKFDEMARLGSTGAHFSPYYHQVSVSVSVSASTFVSMTVSVSVSMSMTVTVTVTVSVIGPGILTVTVIVIMTVTVYVCEQQSMFACPPTPHAHFSYPLGPPAHVQDAVGCAVA